MNKDNTAPTNFFYDSDEEVSWGPPTLREIKKDLLSRRKLNLDPNYRRQTAAFVPLSIGEDTTMFTANSTQSSKDYHTANESLESNTKATEQEHMKDTENMNSLHANSSHMSSDKFVSAASDQNESSEVVTLSSESEDDSDIEESIHVKNERFSKGIDESYKSSQMKGETSDDVICLSSSEDEETGASNNISETSYNQGRDDKENNPFAVEFGRGSNTPKKNHFSQKSSSEEESNRNKDEQTNRSIPLIRIIANTPIKGNKPINRSLNYESNSPQAKKSNLFEESLERSTNQKTPKITIISNTPLKSANYISGNSGVEQNNRSDEDGIVALEDSLQDECVEIMDEKSGNKTSHDDSFCISEKRDVVSSSNRSVGNLSQKENEYEYCEEINETHSKSTSGHYDGFQSLHESPYTHHTLNNSNKFQSYSSKYNSIENDDIEETPSKPTSDHYNGAQTLDENPSTRYKRNNSQIFSISSKQDDSVGNISDDFKEISDTDSKSTSDHCVDMHSLHKNQCSYSKHNKTSSSQIYSISSKPDDSIENISDEIEKIEVSSTSDYRTPYTPHKSSNSRVAEQDDSIENVTEGIEDCSLNDTFAEMEKLLNDGLSDTDDSDDGFIDNTPRKDVKPFHGNISSGCTSRIPVPSTCSEDSIPSNNSLKSNFKIPKFNPKLSKKTPVRNKTTIPKLSPSPLKNIISPVRVYIKNSPCPALKRNIRPQCTKLPYKTEPQADSFSVEHLKHRNILSSLPEVVYKPSKIIEKKTESKIILPKNIKSLITERLVIKHEPRQKVDFDESMFSVEEKLQMSNISRIVSDTHNKSVHTIKQGFNL